MDNMRVDPDPSEAGGDVTQLGELVESYTQEYTSLSSTLDEINQYMDVLEHRADSLYSDLEALLEDNRRTRRELEAQRATAQAEGTVQTGAAPRGLAAFEGQNTGPGECEPKSREGLDCGMVPIDAMQEDGNSEAVDVVEDRGES